MTQRLMAAGLSLLLVSCASSRHSVHGPRSPQELGRLALVVEEAPDGQLTHSWQPVNTLDMADHAERVGSTTLDGQARLVSSLADKCDLVYQDCWYLCMSLPVPPDFDHYIVDSGEKNGKRRYCHDKCTKERNDCYLNARRPHRFEAIDTAVDWVKRHQRELIVGSVIVIAGVVFIVVVVGSGGSATVLAPAVLLVSAEVPTAPSLPEGSE